MAKTSTLVKKCQSELYMFKEYLKKERNENFKISSLHANVIDNIIVRK